MQNDRSGRAWRTLLPTFAGVLAGVATSLLISAYARSPDAGSEQRAKEGNGLVPLLPGAPGGDRPPAGAIERPAAVKATTDKPLPPEVEREEILSRHAEAIAEHRRQPVDEGWAASTSASLQSDLARIGAAKGRFRVVQVDCRETTCIAEMEWPSFDAAREGFGAALHHAYEANCARRVYLPEPSDSSQRYRATMYFDCGQSRAHAAAGRSQDPTLRAQAR